MQDLVGVIVTPAARGPASIRGTLARATRSTGVIFARMSLRSTVVLCLLVTAAWLGGESCARASMAELAWSAPVQIDSLRPFSPFGVADRVSDVSCPSARFCLAVEGANVVISRRPTAGPTAWQTTNLSGVPGYPNTKLSMTECASPQRCWAANTAGGMLMSRSAVSGRASTWRYVRIPSGIEDLTCPSLRLCVAITQVAVLSSTHPLSGPRSWRRVALDRIGDSDSLGGLRSIACPSVRLCVAAGEKADSGSGRLDFGAYLAVSTRPTGGRGAWRLTPPDSIQGDFTDAGAVQCPTVRWCELSGLINFSDNRPAILASQAPAGGSRTWHAVRVRDSQLLTCSTPSFCLDLAGEKAYMSARPLAGLRAWRKQRLRNPLWVASAGALTCVGRSLCVASDEDAGLLTVKDPDRRAWKRIDFDHGEDPLSGISCGAIDLCVAVDDRGRILASATPSSGPWKSVPTPGSGTPISGLPTNTEHISCSSSSFCGMLSSPGLLTSASPLSGPWTRRQINIAAIALACSPSGACLLTSGDGQAQWVPAGPLPEPPVQLGAPTSCDDGYKGACYHDTINEAACGGEAFCAASDGSSFWTTRDPADPHAWRRSELPDSSIALTCTAAPLCVSLSQDGVAATADPTDAAPSWHTSRLPKVPDPSTGRSTSAQPVRVSCAAARSCVIIDGENGYVYHGDPISGTWSAQRVHLPALTDDEDGSVLTPAFTDVSCAWTSDLCAAVDGSGGVQVGRMPS